ncbi:MAG TPA: hypothetical protein VMI54_02605 [Polyangiaceae bacterium]|nr:hypothetical protein [Polyangiaceae bacterium]
MPALVSGFRAVRLLALVAACAVFGCNSTEGECQNVCEWQSRCTVDALGVDDCSQQCVRNIQARSSDCQNAFSDFANCTSENQSCPGVDNQCVSQAQRYIDKCSCADATGALAELCSGQR